MVLYFDTIRVNHYLISWIQQSGFIFLPKSKVWFGDLNF